VEALITLPEFAVPVSQPNLVPVTIQNPATSSAGLLLKSCRQISYLVSAIEAWRRGWSSDRVWKKGADGGLLDRQIKQSKQIRQTDQIERTEQPGYTRQTVQTKQTASIDQAKDIIDLTKGPRVPLDIEPPKWLYSWDEYLSPKPTYEYVNAYMRERYPPERCPCPNSAYFCRLSLASG
jgi:hypothetical protein